ncbi:hypothetical protein HYS92_02680 [Candidatus Daviesbacteria bacterium]|nr:hypothetical protein [Candidatus Daviesbacteria bacterium]
MLERGFERAQQHRENRNPVRQFAIQRAIDMLKAAGVVDSPLEVDLRQQMIDLLPFLVEPTDDEKKELREKRGLVFLPMTSQSYAQVVAESPNHFLDKELEYANGRPALRDFRPPVAVEVGLIEAGLALPGSLGKLRAVALRMIDKYSKDLATEFPDFRAIALPVTGYAKADKAYAERNPG